jgi:hypothetical protein
MPTNNINVKLGKTGTLAVLDVEDNNGQNDVHKNARPTTIVWQLTGNLATGSFAAMDGTDPGFQWLQQPPPGIFEAPEVLPNGKLQVVDKHTDAASTGGPWIYKLRVVHDNKIYTTLSEFEIRPGATVKNPVIVNKDP